MNPDRIKAYAQMRKSSATAPNINTAEPEPNAVQVKILKDISDRHPETNLAWETPKDLQLGFHATIPSEDILFFDVECISLGFTPQNIPYLIGLAWFEKSKLHCAQIFTESPVHEAESLSVLDNYFLRFQNIVSYNGKSFDIPLLRSRFNFLRKAFPEHFTNHFDLYRQIRKIYPEKPARLTDAEVRLLGFKRTDDLPGSYSGQAYFEFLRMGKTDLLERIMRHNLRDVQSLAALTLQVDKAYRQTLGGKTTWAYKIYKDEPDTVARMRLLKGMQDKDAEDWRYLAECYAKQKKWARAFFSWQKSHKLGNGRALPEMVRILGTKLRRIEKAIAIVDKYLPTEEAAIQEKLLHYKTKFSHKIHAG